MRSGARNCLATFYRRDIKDQNGYGETTEKPTVLFKAWCGIDLLSGNKLERANQVAKEATHAIDTRWLAGLNSAQWAEYGGIRYEINAVENVNQRNRDAMILAKAER